MKTDLQDVNVQNQILITGAEPSGLALAAELSRRGATPLIIDREAAGANTSRACVVHARTMEVLEPLGVTRDLLAEGVKIPIFRIRDRDRPLVTIDFSNIPSPYKFTLMIPQHRVEYHLLQHLEGMGCTVMRPCELLRFAALPGRIDAQAQINGSTQSITAQWLIAVTECIAGCASGPASPSRGESTRRVSCWRTCA
jgi:2-polyprenyl-6-methoxyphenol hydroxylase-like FAD-dependent oxidoreductase